MFFFEDYSVAGSWNSEFLLPFPISFTRWVTSNSLRIWDLNLKIFFFMFILLLFESSTFLHQQYPRSEILKWIHKISRSTYQSACFYMTWNSIVFCFLGRKFPFFWNPTFTNLISEMLECYHFIIISWCLWVEWKFCLFWLGSVWYLCSQLELN